MSDTRQRILDAARQLFNERGLHRVGVREIARALEMSPGNLAYHFPTKDDLVTALMLELRDRNAVAVFGELPDDYSLVMFHRAALFAMRSMLHYRFVLLSYVDALMASPELQRLQRELWEHRRSRYDAMLERLVINGDLERRALRGRTRYLHEQGEMIARGWLQAAILYGPSDDQAAVLHYAKLGCALLEPYCTPRGRRTMRRILAGEHDDERSG